MKMNPSMNGPSLSRDAIETRGCNMKQKERIRPQKDESNYLLPIFALIFITTLMMISVPGFTKARERAYQRACYANQKTIAGAIEMYQLDHSANKVTTIDMNLLRELQREGYLKDLIDDPGAGPNTALNYALVNKTVFCVNHGSIQGIDGWSSKPPKEELISAGIKDEKLIDRASATFAPRPMSLKTFIYQGLPFIWLTLVALFFLEIARLLLRKARSVHRYIKTGEE